MALAPVTLERLLWIALPGGLVFASRGVAEFNQGSAWSATAHALMAALVVVAPFVAKERVLAGRLAIGYTVASTLGILAWLAGPTAVVQALGFVVAVVAQITMIVAARRMGVAAPPLRDDSAVELGLNRRVG
jgi:hypothetical protein